VNGLKNTILDIIFPRHCLGCLELLADESASYICRACLAKIPTRQRFACAFCAAPTVSGETCPFCEKDHSLDQLLVVTIYELSLVEKILKAMKYRFVKALADDVARLMIKYLKSKLKTGNLKFETLTVTAVPLYPQRLNWRGFNQSEILAQAISRHFGWSLDLTLLRRIRNPKPQAKIIERAQRIQNIAGAFSCPKPEAVWGQTVLLVDDIATTGSTLDDCARALKGAGAVEVIGFVFARGK